MAIPYGLEARKNRWVNFLDNKNGGEQLFIINYGPDIKTRPQLWPEKQKEQIDWSVEQYYLQMDRMQWLYDDTIPFLDMFTGTEIFAEAFGCKVHRPEDNNPFALPLVHNSAEAARIKPVDLFSSSLTRFFKMADKMKERAGSDAIFRLVDIQSPMDITALIWDKNDLYVALLEEPEAVKELAEKVRILLIAFMDEWFKRYGREFISHFPIYYMPYGISLSEDEIGVVNQDMFMEFFYPELAALSERYGGIGIHCCAKSKHQWNNFKKVPNLRLLNLYGDNNEIKESWEFFADFTAQWPSWFGEGEPWTWPSQYPENARIVMNVYADSREQALYLSEKLQIACRR